MFLVLIFGCIFSQNQSAGSYFAMFLYAGFFCVSKLAVSLNTRDFSKFLACSSSFVLEL